MVEKKPIEKLVCKYNCGAEFDMSPSGQAALMRHYKYDCPNKPAEQKKQEQKTDKETTSEPMIEGKRQEYIASESMLDQSEVLERIIREVSSSKKTPGVLRMVERYMDDPKKSFGVLAEALNLGDFRPKDRSLILKNWAAHLKLGNVEKFIEDEGKDDDQKRDEKKKDEELDIGDAVDKEMDKAIKDETRAMNLLRIRRERKLLERDLEEPKPEPKMEEEKQTIIIEGVPLKVTPIEMLGWKKYISDEKERQEERDRKREEQKLHELERQEERDRKREEQKLHEQEVLRKKDDDTVEWPIGDKIVNVKQSTIPLLVYQQTQKKEGSSDDMKMLMDKMVDKMEKQSEQFHQFQVQVLQKEVEELKQYATQDPLDRLYTQKEKLEKLGIVRSDKMSAQEQMYQMDHKKLDTLLSIATDKSKSTENKVNTLLNTVGPAAQDYIREIVLQMKQQRGAIPPEAPITKQQASETLEALEEVDKAMTSSAPVSQFVSVGKSEPKTVPPKEGA